MYDKCTTRNLVLCLTDFSYHGVLKIFHFYDAIKLGGIFLIYMTITVHHLAAILDRNFKNKYYLHKNGAKDPFLLDMDLFTFRQVNSLVPCPHSAVGGATPMKNVT